MTENSNNIVLFPGVNPETFKVPESVDEMRKRAIERVVNEIQDAYLAIMQKNNIKMRNDPLYLQDLALIKEATRAGASRASGYSHSFHRLAETLFKVEEDEDSYSVLPDTSVNVSFTKKIPE